jgi:ribosome-associated protein YbcJ (S4-like RNA binding protein)
MHTNEIVSINKNFIQVSTTRVAVMREVGDTKDKKLKVGAVIQVTESFADIKLRR